MPPTSTRSRLPHVAETLALAAIGGTTLGLLHFPAGWLTGAMLTVATAALSGRPMHIPGPLAQVIFTLIGISLGSVVTPETVRGMATWPLSVAIMLVTIVAVSFATSAYLRYVHDWDRTSALLGGAPGALSQVMVMSLELKVDVRPVIVVQTIRVVIIAAGVPVLLTLLGLVGPNPRGIGGAYDPKLLGELLMLIAISSIAAVAFHRFRIPGGLLFGSMLCSAVLHGSGWIHAVMPWWAANAAMIALGATTGSRFANTTFKLLLKFLLAAIGSFGAAIATTAVFVAVLVLSMPLRMADVVIAFAPGSVDAMMVVALALNLDPVYVGAHHLVRIMFVSVALPFASRLSARRLPTAEPPASKRSEPFED